MKAKRELTQIIFLFIVFMGLIAFHMSNMGHAAALSGLNSDSPTSSSTIEALLKTN